MIVGTSVTSAGGMDLRPRTAEDLAAMYADAYFDKPVALQALLATVAELLKERSAPASGFRVRSSRPTEAAARPRDAATNRMRLDVNGRRFAPRKVPAEENPPR